MVDFLEKCRKHGNYIIVGVHNDWVGGYIQLEMMIMCTKLKGHSRKYISVWCSMRSLHWYTCMGAILILSSPVSTLQLSYTVIITINVLVSYPDLYFSATEEQSGNDRTCCPTFEGRDQSDIVQ